MTWNISMVALSHLSSDSLLLRFWHQQRLCTPNFCRGKKTWCCYFGVSSSCEFLLNRCAKRKHRHSFEVSGWSLAEIARIIRHFGTNVDSVSFSFRYPLCYDLLMAKAKRFSVFETRLDCCWAAWARPLAVCYFAWRYCFQESSGNVAPSGEDGFTEDIQCLELVSIFASFPCHPTPNIVSWIGV